MKTLKTLTLIMVLLGCGALPAQARNVKEGPGYVDLSWLEIPADAEEVQDMDLGQVLKSVASDAEANGDSELAKALTMVKSIRLKAFSVTPETEEMVNAASARIKKTMDQDDWNRMIYMKDKGEEMSVHTKYNKDGKLVGLMVMAIKMDDMATFANVVGDLDLVTLMHLMGSMDEDTLDGYLQEFEDAGVHLE